MGEWAPILALFGTFFIAVGGFAGTVYVTRSKTKADEPFEMLRQYKTMVDTLRTELIDARQQLGEARKEAHSLRNEVMGLRREIAKARAENEALRIAHNGGASI